MTPHQQAQLQQDLQTRLSTLRSEADSIVARWERDRRVGLLTYALVVGLVFGSLALGIGLQGCQGGIQAAGQEGVSGGLHEGRVP